MRSAGLSSAPAAGTLRVSSSQTSGYVRQFDRPSSPIDFKLLFVVVTLSLVGLVLVYASTYHLGAGYLKWQFIRTGVGLLAMLVGITFDHARLASRNGRLVILGLTVLALVVTLVWGEAVGVARRNVMNLVQPSEFAKYGLVLWLAGYFADLKESGRARGIVNSLVKPGLVIALVVGLTLLQPAVGTSAIMGVTAASVLFIAGVKKRYLFVGLIAVVLLGAGGVSVLGRSKLVDRLVGRHERAAAGDSTGSKFDYVFKRWTSFSGGQNYHQTQSLIAVGSGGLWGKGLGEGKQKYYFVPKLHKDFIFATVGEEFGFVGSLLVLLLYLLLFTRGMRISLRATTDYGRYLAAGITVTIFLYSLVHEAVVLALIPTTGQPLPFVSYGGSALVANMLAAGMVLRISRFRRPGLDEVADSSWWNRRSRLPGTRGGI